MTFKKPGIFIIIFSLLAFLIFFRGLIPEFTGLYTIIFFISCTAIIALKSKRHLDLSDYMLALMNIFYLAISLIFYDYEYFRFFIGIYFAYFYFYAFYAFSSKQITLNEFNTALNIIIFLSLLSLFTSIIQSFILEVNSDASSLFIIRGYSAFFDNSITFTISLTILIPILLYKSKEKPYFVILAFIIFVFVFLTGTRKAILASIIVLFMFALFLGKPKHKIMAFISFSIILSLIYFFSHEQIHDRISHLNHYKFIDYRFMVARTVLLYESLNIASSNFPFGTGPGTFASVPAAVFYSPVYYETGLFLVHGLGPDVRSQPGMGNYLNDTFYPQLIAELGFIGAFLWMLFFLKPLLMTIQHHIKSKTSRNSINYFLIYSFYTIALIESTGSPFLTNPSAVVFFIPIVSFLTTRLLNKAT